jgi:hypothetical protein
MESHPTTHPSRARLLLLLLRLLLLKCRCTRSK